MRVLSFAVCLLISTAAMAAEVPEVPPDLMFDGKPLDPMCFQRWEDREAVNVRDCAEPDILPEPAEWTDLGWYGYTFRLKDLPAEAPMRGWASWRYLGATDQGHVVETLYNGGGTGHFSTVETVRRDGDQLVSVITHAGGDRCNGGVEAAAVAGGQVVTASNITPYDLVSLALGEDPPVKAYDDLAACAICCVGTATVVGDDLAWVTLTPMDSGFAGPDQPVQACLDRLLQSQRNALTPAELTVFGKTFRTECLK